jgi:hypothetical protein
MKSQYSKASDVFAFGVLCFEVLTNARPWAELTAAAAVVRVTSGERVEAPDAPKRVRELMQWCMQAQSTDRPVMREVRVS